MSFSHHPRISILGVLLLFAPTIIFVLDQLNISWPGDEFTWAVILGGLGTLTLASSQRGRAGRLVIALVIGLVVLVSQFYLISVFVLSR